jgi:hypothetical protein
MIEMRLFPEKEDPRMNIKAIMIYFISFLPQ